MPATNAQFADVYQALRLLLKSHEGALNCTTDEPHRYTLVTKSNSNRGKPMWFGEVRQGKAYVSYHLMPLYFNPRMNALVPTILKKRMQGKTCFNFKTIDKQQLEELTKLTGAAVDDYRQRQLL